MQNLRVINEEVNNEQAATRIKCTVAAVEDFRQRGEKEGPFFLLNGKTSEHECSKLRIISSSS
jgi:hypothetical protein